MPKSAARPDTYVPPSVQRYLDTVRGLHSLLPATVDFIDRHADDLTGYALAIAHSGGYLCICKRFGFDGSPEIIFAGGATPIEAMLAGEKALAAGNWKPDRPRPPAGSKPI